VRQIALVSLLVALPLLASGAEAQVAQRGDRAQAEAAHERRAQLEQQIRERFLAQAAQRLRLDDQQRERLGTLLERGAEHRRQLAHDSWTLRVELMRAVRDETTPRHTYERLLQQLEEVRDREAALERRESAALARFLEPRQQAVFLVMRIEFNEQVRGMRGAQPGERRRGPGGAGGPGGT
jgi:hypothetical protein